MTGWLNAMDAVSAAEWLTDWYCQILSWLICKEPLRPPSPRTIFNTTWIWPHNCNKDRLHTHSSPVYFCVFVYLFSIFCYSAYASVCVRFVCVLVFGDFLTGKRGLVAGNFRTHQITFSFFYNTFVYFFFFFFRPWHLFSFTFHFILLCVFPWMPLLLLLRVSRCLYVALQYHNLGEN